MTGATTTTVEPEDLARGNPRAFFVAIRGARRHTGAMSTAPDSSFEQAALARGFTRIAGVDEVGRGPLCGPVTAAAVVLGAILGFLVWAVPVKDGMRDWTGQMIPGGWMAWTFPTALFFWVIAALLLVFTWLAIRSPETPRRGILGIWTTRGDRLFISLLGSAFINLAWLGFGGVPAWGGLILSLIYAAAVFRWV